MRIAVIGALALAVAGLGLYVVRQQQTANREILGRLDEMRAALNEQNRRSGDLTDQVAALTDRVGHLEADNRDLRRQIAALLRRKPAEVAAISLAHPLDAIPLAPLAEPSHALAEPFVLEPVPITWAVDWSSYQPAGIVAPAPGIALQRKITDPAFVRRMYYTYAALQVTDAVTTLTAVQQGARETNPLLQNAAQNPAAMIAIKAATIGGTILAVETLRKKNPVVATATIIALNATLAVVAVNNISVNTKQSSQ